MMIDTILEVLEKEAIELGNGLIQHGVNLIRRHLNGEATDEEIMAWLRAVQERESDA